MADDTDLFEAEEAELARAVDVHARADGDAGGYRNALGDLIVRYRRMMRETRRMIRHGDRQERELNALNACLAVIRFKQLRGFYFEDIPYYHLLLEVGDLKTAGDSELDED